MLGKIQTEDTEKCSEKMLIDRKIFKLKALVSQFKFKHVLPLDFNKNSLKSLAQFKVDYFKIFQNFLNKLWYFIKFRFSQIFRDQLQDFLPLVLQNNFKSFACLFRFSDLIEKYLNQKYEHVRPKFLWFQSQQKELENLKPSPSYYMNTNYLWMI